MTDTRSRSDFFIRFWTQNMLIVVAVTLAFTVLVNLAVYFGSRDEAAWCEERGAVVVDAHFEGHDLPFQCKRPDGTKFDIPREVIYGD